MGKKKADFDEVYRQIKGMPPEKKAAKKKGKGPLWLAFGVAASAGLIGFGFVDSANENTQTDTEVSAPAADKASSTSASDVSATNAGQDAAKDFATAADKNAGPALDTTTTRVSPVPPPQYNDYSYNDYYYDYYKYGKNPYGPYGPYGPNHHIPY